MEARGSSKALSHLSVFCLAAITGNADDIPTTMLVAALAASEFKTEEEAEDVIAFETEINTHTKITLSPCAR